MTESMYSTTPKISLALIHISSHLNKTLHSEESLNPHMTFPTCDYNGRCLGDLRLRRMEPANTSMWYIVLMPHAVCRGVHTFCYFVYSIISKKNYLSLVQDYFKYHLNTLELLSENTTAIRPTSCTSWCLPYGTVPCRVGVQEMFH